MVWTTKELEFVSKQELEIFAFSTAFGLASVPIQALSQFMLGTFSLGGRGRKLTTCLQ
jgi:hypothetical protein